MTDGNLYQERVEAAYKRKNDLIYRAVYDEDAVQIFTGATILSAETIDAPVTDGWLLLMDSPNYGLLFVELYDLMCGWADPDDLAQFLEVKVAVVEPGRQTVKFKQKGSDE